MYNYRLPLQGILTGPNNARASFRLAKVRLLYYDPTSSHPPLTRNAFLYDVRPLPETLEPYIYAHMSAAEQAQRDAAAFERAQELLGAGQLKEDRGDAQGALELYEQCRSCARLISVPRSAKAVELAALGSLGGICTSLGQYERAIEYLDKTLAICRENHDRRNEGSALGSLGNAYASLGKYESAIEYLTRSLLISRETRDREAEASNLGDRGVAYAKHEKYTEAIEDLLQSLTICRELGNKKSEAGRLGSLGLIHKDLGRYEQAIDFIKQALKLSCELGNRQSEGIQLCNLGTAVSKLGQHEEAIHHYMRALSIIREGEHREAEGSVMLNLGHIHLRDLNDPTNALQWLKNSRGVFDALWDDLTTDDHRVSFADTYSSCSRMLQLAHTRLDQPEAALEESERARSRSFEVLLAQQRAASGKGLAPDAFAAAGPVSFEALQGAAVRQRVTIIFYSAIVSSWAQPIAWVVRGGAGLQMKQITVPSGDASLTRLTELTRRAIGASARHGEASGRSTQRADPLGLLTPMVDEALTEALGCSRDIEALDDQSGTPDSLTDLLRRGYDMLIAPLGLTDGEPLLLVPDGDLYAMPFAALLAPNGKHLIEAHSLRVAPSVGTVVELEARATRRAAPSGAALVVGNPNFHGWASQLPAAEMEAQNVAAALSASAGLKNGVTTLVGDHATNDAVVEAMRGCDVVHLATHGTAESVLLGGATRTEGALTMAEVQGLDLSARLVVLSECDSFRGKLTTDGVIGITRAFVAAGALSLVASLWKVHDEATRELMERFYQRLLASGEVGDVAAAMQGAMISMIREGHSSVPQWAAFVVYGLADFPGSHR